MADIDKKEAGHLHLMSKSISQIISIFDEMGFTVADGPDIETEHYNFDALNIPKDHPARDLWDTFWLKDSDQLLRTHTSPVQIRYMEENDVPIRIIAPGKVYRYEATDSTHETGFYQLEGVVIGKDITLGHLKYTLETFLSKFYGQETEIRFRPSYFPFVEPALEVDMKFRGEWMEILGAGMVHPAVLNGVGIDPRKWQGFAFGVGIERIVMPKHEIDDVRLIHNGDLRFVQQF